ncbi:MAG: hypothetical protein N2Z74_05065, partial [Syntrophales bacterium]|nr:hypothetical protein [Syntrophales bacterium]
PAGVRAYPVGEGSGAMGHAFTVEARMDVPFFPSWAVTQVVGFFDAGWVKLYKDVWSGAVNNISGRGDYWLSGAGVGLNVGKAGLYSMRVSYAHKVGVNDGRSVLGKDADGRSDDGRFWLQLLVWI